MGSTDIFEEWKGQIQKLRDSHEAKLNEVARDLGVSRRDLDSGRYRRKRAMEAQDSWEAQEAATRAQREAQSLSERLRGAREALDRMHVPGCLRVGYNCPACEELEDLDSY